MPWVSEHAVKHPRDVEAAGYLFSHIGVEPRFDGYAAKRDEIGDDGILVAHTSDFACPMQHIMGALMSIEQFFYALRDAPLSIERLASQMGAVLRAAEGNRRQFARGSRHAGQQL